MSDRNCIVEWAPYRYQVLFHQGHLTGKCIVDSRDQATPDKLNYSKKIELCLFDREVIPDNLLRAWYHEEDGKEGSENETDKYNFEDDITTLELTA